MLHTKINNYNLDTCTYFDKVWSGYKLLQLSNSETSQLLSLLLGNFSSTLLIRLLFSLHCIEITDRKFFRKLITFLFLCYECFENVGKLFESFSQFEFFRYIFNLVILLCSGLLCNCQTDAGLHKRTSSI